MVILARHCPGADPHWFPPFNENQSDYSQINIFLRNENFASWYLSNILSERLKTQETGDFRGLKSRKINFPATPWKVAPSAGI